MSGFIVTNPGMLSLVQDAGRLGKHCFGLTSSGPVDEQAYYWGNRLLKNPVNTSVIEINLGGLHLESAANTQICLTGAPMPFSINGQACEAWRTYRVRTGDQVHLGFPPMGCRSYFAVSGGFVLEKQFGSTATVMREGIGGLSGGKLQRGEFLACADTSTQADLCLPDAHRPQYTKEMVLRVIPGYQWQFFTREARRVFYSAPYQVSQQCDRMGVRFHGAAVPSQLQRIYSEGITLGAIQVPADGQPIVLMHDRQTIGGYPKLGNVLSLDLSRLSQCTPGSTIFFNCISVHAARSALLEDRRRRQSINLQVC